MSYRSKIELELQELMKNSNVGGHGIDHFIDVADHATLAVQYENLDEQTKLQIILAALLHDADEKKLFTTKNNSNARTILDKVIDFPNKDTFIEDIIDMINLVSCSEHGDDEVPHPWMAIPRDCDRLTAIGEIGIKRCKEFTDHIKNPYHTDDTPRATSVEEVLANATYERFVGYKSGVPSTSMIDHYYDKLLHIGRPECLRSQNKYILEEANRRNGLMATFVVDYWCTN